jgi:four helix bundle protein
VFNSKPWDLRVRTAAFAKDVVVYCRTLPVTDEAREVAGQLRRAARSVAANYRAARRGRSKLEFIAKIGIALEEADEAEFWLSHLMDTGIMAGKETENLHQEAGELVAILTTSQRNGRGR